jgi:hypothetical protein
VSDQQIDLLNLQGADLLGLEYRRELGALARVVRRPATARRLGEGDVKMAEHVAITL